MAQLGMVGLGRMGSNLVRRLMRDGHDCVVYDVNPDPIKELAGEGRTAGSSLKELAEKLDPPRAVWVMVPAGEIHREHGQGGSPRCSTRATRSSTAATPTTATTCAAPPRWGRRGSTTSTAAPAGASSGLDRGFCLMIGGPDGAVERLDPIFKTIAPGVESAERDAGAHRRPRHGREWLPPLWSERRGPLREDGPQRNRIRRDGGLRRGLNILKNANAGKVEREMDAETAPLENPEYYRYDLDIPEVAEGLATGKRDRAPGCST